MIIAQNFDIINWSTSSFKDTMQLYKNARNRVTLIVVRQSSM